MRNKPTVGGKTNNQNQPNIQNNFQLINRVIFPVMKIIRHEKRSFLSTIND